MYYGLVTIFQGLFITAAIFVVQAAWSNYWLRYYKYGLMEWVWRVMTYKKMQPFRLHD